MERICSRRRRTVRSGPALPFFPLPLVDIADRIHSLLNTLLKPFRCPPDRSSDVLLIAQQTFSRRAPDGIIRRHRRKRRGQQCKGNAFHPTFKIPGQILSTKYRQSPPRRRSARQRGSPAGTKSCGIGLPTARNPEDGAPTPRNSGVPGVPEGRNATFRDRSTPEPQDTEVSEHRNREAREPQDTKATRYRNRKTQRSRGSGTARLKGLGAQGTSRRRTLPARPPAVSGPSPRSRRSGTCRRPRGGRAGRHPRSPRCSGGSGTRSSLTMYSSLKTGVCV